MNLHLATLLALLALAVNWDETKAKSLTSDAYYNKASNPVPGYHQTSNPQHYPQHQGTYQSPTYPEYDENMESYEYPSSEEIMPVKNSQYVPVELPGESDYNSTGGYVPQRQVSLQQFWQHHMLQQNYSGNNSGVTDEGNIEVISIPNSDTIKITNGGAPLSQYYQEQQQNTGAQNYHQEQHTVPTTSSSTPSPFPTPSSTPKTKKSNVHKLVVEARRTGDGKIAVVKDKLRAARERRSMMTLSREDENDSEYDDFEIVDKTKASKNSTIKATAKPKH